MVKSYHSRDKNRRQWLITAFWGERPERGVNCELLSAIRNSDEAPDNFPQVAQQSWGDER